MTTSMFLVAINCIVHRQSLCEPTSVKYAYTPYRAIYRQLLSSTVGQIQSSGCERDAIFNLSAYKPNCNARTRERDGSDVFVGLLLVAILFLAIYWTFP